MLEHSFENLIQEQVHLHRVLVLLLLVLHQLTILDLDVEAAVSVQLDQHILQSREGFMILFSIITKHLDTMLLL